MSYYLCIENIAETNGQGHIRNWNGSKGLERLVLVRGHTTQNDAQTAVPTKIPMILFTEIEKQSLKVCAMKDLA